MSFLKAKKDLQLMTDFLANTEKLWKLEDEKSRSRPRRPTSLAMLSYNVEEETDQSQTDEYQRVRDSINLTLQSAISIARKHRVPIDAQSFPPPAVGGVIITFNYFTVILKDNTHGGINRQTIRDVIVQTIGACQNHIKAEKEKLYNPIHWVTAAFSFVLQIPYKLLKMSGFNVDKIEDQMWAKVFKLIYIVFIFAFLVYVVGVSKDKVIEVVLTLVK
jgi:hypothetical protein